MQQHCIIQSRTSDGVEYFTGIGDWTSDRREAAWFSEDDAKKVQAFMQEQVDAYTVGEEQIDGRYQLTLLPATNPVYTAEEVIQRWGGAEAFAESLDPSGI